MKLIWVVALRELRSFFDSLTAYILLVIFLGLSGFFHLDLWIRCVSHGAGESETVFWCCLLDVVLFYTSYNHAYHSGRKTNRNH